MKIKVFLTAMLLFCLSSAVADTATTNNPDQSNNQATSTADNEPNANQSTKDDAETLAQLLAIDKTEEDAADLALKKKNLNSNVQKFANMMKTAHSQHYKDTKKLADRLNIKPENTTAAEDLYKKGKSLKSQLKPLQGGEFESAYVDAMISGHTDALNLLHDKIKQTSNTQMKEFLEQTQKVVQMHLDEAKNLKNKMNG